MSLYTSLARPLLFRLPAEWAHHLAVEACRIAGALPGVPAMTRACWEHRDPVLETEVAGLRFANPLGLAAGWDKSGRALRMLDALGFGFAEIGSVSARPSLGNPRPRLFRLPEDRAILVNYGLPNDGAERVARRLAAHRGHHPLGVNLVKTNDGPSAPPGDEDEILGDYHRSVMLTHSQADYLTLNLSCPNAAGGKDHFACPGTITRLLDCLRPIGITCPVFLKVAPQDAPAEHARLLAECDGFPFVRGFSFNLPAGKPGCLRLRTPPGAWSGRPGAVAGKPVEELINRCVAGLYARMDRQRHVILAAGGVFDAEDAYRKIRLGASLVQIYTALIYEGPAVVGSIARGLGDLLRRDGFANVREAVGADVTGPC